jgi:DNA repair photolyase
MKNLKVREMSCKSVLNKSGITSIDYALNPYTGCEHGCRYCYAVFMKRFTNHKEPWGAFVDVKVNAPEVLAKQLISAKAGMVSLSTVTDPYQPLEKKYRITRRCIEELAPYDLPLSILTKSPLVTRDIEVLRKFSDLEVGFSIAFLDESVRETFEARTPLTTARIEAARELAGEGIKTWFFLAPVFPGFSDQKEQLDQFFSQAGKVGVDYVLVDTLQLYTKPWANIREIIVSKFPLVFPDYLDYRKHKLSYKEELKKKVKRIAKKHCVRCKFTW